MGSNRAITHVEPKGTAKLGRTVAMTPRMPRSEDTMHITGSREQLVTAAARRWRRAATDGRVPGACRWSAWEQMRWRAVEPPKVRAVSVSLHTEHSIDASAVLHAREGVGGHGGRARTVVEEEEEEAIDVGPGEELVVGVHWLRSEDPV